MAKAYWVVAWRSGPDQAAVDRYVPPASAAILSHGGRVIAGGVPAKAYEQGLPSRLVVVEFESLPSAVRVPFGDTVWQHQAANALGLLSSLRERGRPKKAVEI